MITVEQHMVMERWNTHECDSQPKADHQPQARTTSRGTYSNGTLEEISKNQVR